MYIKKQEGTFWQEKPSKIINIYLLSTTIKILYEPNYIHSRRMGLNSAGALRGGEFWGI